MAEYKNKKNNNTKCHLQKFFTQHAKLSVNCRKITVVLEIPMFALRNKKFIKPFWWSKKHLTWRSVVDCHIKIVLHFLLTRLSEHPDVQGWSKPKYTEPKRNANGKTKGYYLMIVELSLCVKCRAVEIPCPTCPACAISLKTSEKFRFICPGKDFTALANFIKSIQIVRYLFFLFLKNICYGYLLKVPHRGTFNEYP